MYKCNRLHKDSDSMRKIKAIGLYILGLLMIVSSVFVASQGSMFAAGSGSETQNGPQSYSDQTGLFMKVDQLGNVEYVEAEGIDIQDQLALPEEENKDTTFDLKLTIGEEERLIHSYDSFEEANAALNRQSKFRGVGSMGVYTDDQVRSVTNGVVNFNTKGNALTEYEEDGTGARGYTNGAYGADGAYLETNAEGTKVKFKMAGVVGWVNKSDVQILNYDTTDVLSVNYYKVKSGRIYHYITTNVSVNAYAASYDVGPAQSYMKEGGVYYSYDGHYFYTSYATMVLDYKTNTNAYPRSINPTMPYYNYFQFLSHRTKTNFSTSTIDNYINNNVSGQSAIKNQGFAYMNAQNTYGANATLVFGLSVNESAWGKSNIALTKNNIFGHAAYDTNTGAATTYASVEQSILQHAQEYVSNNYLDPKDYSGLYHGPHLGDKASGMGVKYASDPYWGEKAAAQGYGLERYAGNKNVDYNKYTIGIKQQGVDLTVRKDPNKDSTALYKTGAWSNFPFVILGSVQGDSVNGNTKWYKIQTDPPLNSTRTETVQSFTGKTGGEYNYENNYAYVSAAYVNLVNEGTGGNSDGGSSGVVRGDVNGNGKVDAADYLMTMDTILGKYTMSATQKTAADVNKNGKVDAADYLMIMDCILGKITLN